MRIEVEDLTVWFGERVLVRVDELAVSSGELLFIKGSTGSGKTVLLKTILGVTTPKLGVRASGRVRVGGVAVEQDKPPSWVRVGYHPQKFEYSFITPRVGEELVSVLLTLGYDFRRAVVKAHSMLEAVGLGDYFMREINSLSGGEMQCISVLRALACKPELLVLDEPFTQIDSMKRRVLVGFLREALETEDEAVVLVTGHNWLIEGLAPAKTFNIEASGGVLEDFVFKYKVERAGDVRINGLFFSYNGKTVFRNAEVRIDNGEFIGLVGPNGSGKTTLIKIIMGFLKPPRGVVRVCGLDPAAIGVSKTPFVIGYTSQFPSACLLSDSVRMELLQASKRARVDFETSVKLARSFGLKSGLDTPIHKLTLCEQVALSLAVSVLFKPSIIVVDEIHQCCDPAFTRLILSRLRKYCDNGVTVIVSSHSEELLRGYCDRILRVSGGGVVG